MSGDTAILTAVAQAVRSVIQDGAQMLLDLLGRLVRGIRVIAPAVFAAGCASESVDAAVVRAAPASEAAVVLPPASETLEPQPLGRFSFTFYYITREEDVAARAAARAAREAKAARLVASEAGDGEAEGEDDPVGELAAIAVPELVPVFEGGTCKRITKVTKDYAVQLALQGTGQLKDGRVINIWGRCDCERSPCFKVTSSKWGTAGNGRSLQPFRTVAVDPRVIKLGTLLHVPKLEGRTMPGKAPWGGFVHDGCVVADDTGGGIIGKQMDLFVGRRKHYFALSGADQSHAWAKHLAVYDGSKICERKGRRVRRKAASI